MDFSFDAPATCKFKGESSKTSLTTCLCMASYLLSQDSPFEVVSDSGEQYAVYDGVDLYCDSRIVKVFEELAGVQLETANQ